MIVASINAHYIVKPVSGKHFELFDRNFSTLFASDWQIMTMEKITEFLDKNADLFEEELFEFLRIPSVSTDSGFDSQTSEAGAWIAEKLSSTGLDTEIIQTNRHPIVYSQSKPVPGKPIVLVYGHYDVQPPDPLDEWETPPFEPTRRNGNVYARGATDDKGQLYTHIKSVESWMKTVGELPVQVKFLIEGEEECGSGSVYEFLDGQYDASIDKHSVSVRELLRSDIAVISDNSQFGPGRPAITYGLRGIAYFELRLTGPKQDLHSGAFGGAVTNPCNVLSSMLAALKDLNGKIQVPGFFDDVVPLSNREREQLANLPFDENGFRKQISVDGLTGEDGYSTLERRWARPTCDVNGIWGGYQGEGAKTVMPAKAGAKFSFRLVPNQDAEAISKSVEAMFRKMCPPGIKMELVNIHAGNGVVVPLESPFIEAAENAIDKGFGIKPVFIREGGSIPIVSTLKEKLGVDTLLLGWGLGDDNTHSPNEKFHLADFHRGTRSSAFLLDEIGKMKTN